MKNTENCFHVIWKQISSGYRSSYWMGSWYLVSFIGFPWRAKSFNTKKYRTIDIVTWLWSCVGARLKWQECSGIYNLWPKQDISIVTQHARVESRDSRFECWHVTRVAMVKYGCKWHWDKSREWSVILRCPWNFRV